MQITISKKPIDFFSLPLKERINYYLQYKVNSDWNDISSENLKELIKDIDNININLPISQNATLLLRKAMFYKLVFDYDSALKILDKTEELIKKNNLKKLYARLYNEYAQVNAHVGKLDKSLQYFKKLIEILEKREDKKELVFTYFHIGNIYRRLRNYGVSLTYYNKSLDLAKEFNQKINIANCYSDLGLLYMMKSNFQTSLSYMIKALDLYEELDDKSKTYIVYTNIGNLYFFIGNYENAINYYVKAIVLGNKQKDYEKLSKLYNNLGSTYINIKDFDKAVVYLEKSAEMKRKIHDNIGLAKTLNNLGEFYMGQKKYDNSLKAFEKSLRIKIDMNDIQGEIVTLTNLAKIRLLKEDYNYVVPYLAKALQLNKKESSTANILNIYKTFEDYYKSIKKFDKAIEYFKLYKKTSKILKKEQSNKKLNSLLAKYENERKEKEKEIYHLKNIELRKANATKDRFFSIIAHDLKSPFSTIIAFISLMKKRYNTLSSEKVAHLIDELEKNVNATFSLLENLLTWSKLQSKSMKYNPQQTTIYEVVNYIFVLTEFMAKEKGISLINNLDKSATVYADKFMLATIIRNLVTNAIKFTETGGSITISAEKMKNHLEIFVKDTGVGMSADKMDKLFKIETSFSTYGTRNEKGTGLGLILCKEFAEKNNGNIRVKSKEGKGTTFIVKLPSNPLEKE